MGKHKKIKHFKSRESKRKYEAFKHMHICNIKKFRL